MDRIPHTTIRQKSLLIGGLLLFFMDEWLRCIIFTPMMVLSNYSIIMTIIDSFSALEATLIIRIFSCPRYFEEKRASICQKEGVLCR